MEEKQPLRNMEHVLLQLNRNFVIELRCKRCHQFVVYYRFYTFQLMQCYDSQNWLLKVDMTELNFQKTITGNRISCVCGNYLGRKWNNGQTKVFKGGLYKIVFERSENPPYETIN